MVSRTEETRFYNDTINHTIRDTEMRLANGESENINSSIVDYEETHRKYRLAR